MNLKNINNEYRIFNNLKFYAKQIMEGYISGIHKSPFHGYSSEFLEHKTYNTGESTKHIDWKLFAKSDKLYTKKYEDETNLRCHLIIDNSSSMHFPTIKKQSLENYNKIGFSILASACLIEIIRKQRDAIGLSIFNEEIDYHTPAKNNNRHINSIINQLELISTPSSSLKKTKLSEALIELGNTIPKRSVIIIFSDLFINKDNDINTFFDALQFLKHKKHEIIIFQTLDFSKEILLNLENEFVKLVDLENQEEINVQPRKIKENYEKRTSRYLKAVSYTHLTLPTTSRV